MLYKGTGKCRLAKYRLLKSSHDLNHRSEGYIIWGIYLNVGDLHFPLLGMCAERYTFVKVILDEFSCIK